MTEEFVSELIKPVEGVFEGSFRSDLKKKIS